MKDKVLSFGRKDKIGYFLGSMGNDFTFQLASGYLMLFYTKGLGLEAGLIGTLILITKGIDAITDIAMGYMSDHLKDSNRGRYRPWIKKMSLPVAISSFLMYNAWIINWSSAHKLMYLFISYLMWSSVFYTSINIPYSALTSSMTNDMGERASLSTYRTMGSVIAGTFIGVTTPLVIYLRKDQSLILSPHRFMIWAFVLSTCAFIAYRMCFYLCQERIIRGGHHSGENRKAAMLKQEGLKELIHLLCDRSFMSLIGVSILCTLAMMTGQLMNQYVFLDYFGTVSGLSMMALFMTLMMGAVSPLTQRLTRLFGKKRVSLLGLLMASLAYLAAFVWGRNILMYILFNLIAYGGLAFFSLTNWAFVADVIDDYYVRNGSRPEGRFYAIYSFSRKLGQALVGGLGGGLLSFVHYQSLAVQQTPLVKESVFAIATLMPAVTLLIAGLLLGIGYPLNHTKVKGNQEWLQKTMG